MPAETAAFVAGTGIYAGIRAAADTAYEPVRAKREEKARCKALIDNELRKEGILRDGSQGAVCIVQYSEKCYKAKVAAERRKELAAQRQVQEQLPGAIPMTFTRLPSEKQVKLLAK